MLNWLNWFLTAETLSNAFADVHNSFLTGNKSKNVLDVLRCLYFVVQPCMNVCELMLFLNDIHTFSQLLRRKT